MDDAERIAKEYALAAQVAQDFASALHTVLSAEQWAEMKEKNSAEPKDSLICHSHDYCDANVYMAEAIQTVLGRPVNIDAESADDDTSLWNLAWEIAKEKYLS